MSSSVSGRDEGFSPEISDVVKDSSPTLRRSCVGGVRSSANADLPPRWGPASAVLGPLVFPYLALRAVSSLDNTARRFPHRPDIVGSSESCCYATTGYVIASTNQGYATPHSPNNQSAGLLTCLYRHLRECHHIR